MRVAIRIIVVTVKSRQLTSEGDGYYQALQCLLSADEDNEVRIIHVNDQGSQTGQAEVLIQGVPAVGILDSGADITIIGAELFKKIAVTDKVNKKHFKKPDRVPKTYDGHTFSLDG